VNRLPSPRRFVPLGEIPRTGAEAEPRQPVERQPDRRDAEPVRLPSPQRPKPALAPQYQRIAVHVTADLNIPPQRYYARHVSTLLKTLRELIEEECPWLDDVRVDIRRP